MKLTSLGFPLMCDQRSSSEPDNSHTFSTPSRLLHCRLQLLTSQTLPIRRQGVPYTLDERVSRLGLHVDLENRGTSDRSLPFNAPPPLISDFHVYATPERPPSSCIIPPDHRIGAMTEPSGLSSWLINPFGTRAVHIDT